MLERVVGVTRGRVKVVAGVGGPSTADGVANARIARDAGADALLVFPIAAFLSEPRFEGMPVILEGPGIDGKGIVPGDIALAREMRDDGVAARAPS